ncbi:guanylate kinase domain-containing protein [Ditylenchus destructor]|nr:guanylate kinase domain-containing protein [Ditylenchus destructor]
MDNWESVISQIEHSKQQIVESIEAAERLKVKSPLHAVSPNSHNRNPNGVNNVQRGSTSKQLLPTQGQNSSKLSDAKRVLCISCGKDRTIPFVVEGGSENGELIFVGAILEPSLSLHVGDVLFAINGIQLSGRVLSEVSAFLYTLFYERNEITIELIPAGGIPIDIREVLEDNKWSELHSVLRDNVYLRTVPCTTRPPTEDEVDGEHYYFVSTSRFIDLLEAGVFLEHGIFQGECGNWKATEVRADGSIVAVMGGIGAENRWGRK